MIDVRGLIQEVKNKLGLILLAGIVTAYGFFIYSTTRLTPTYQAGFSAYINNASSNSIVHTLNSGDTSAAESLAYTYAKIMRSRPLVMRALESANLPYTYESVAGRISSDTEELTQLITVRVTMTSPEDAYKVAFALSETAPSYMEEIVMGSSMKIIEDPVFPTSSNYPNVKRNTMTGGIIGLVVALYLVVILFIYDDRVKSPEVLERKFDCAVIGQTPDIFASSLYNKRYGREVDAGEQDASGGSGGTSSSSSSKDEAGKKKLNVHKKTDKELLILSDDSPWAVQEAFRKMRSNLIFSLPGNEGRVIGVTSARSHDGKTVNTVNLAISFAQVGRKVLLMEGDLRKPAVAELTGVEEIPGLSELVTGQCTLEEAIHKDEKHNLDVIPSGTLPPDPTWILQTEAMKNLMADLKTKYDFVIFDLPPVVTVTDAVIVADSLDGYLMVVRHGRTKLSDVDRMISQLRLANSRIIGFVENQAVNESDPNLKDYSYKKKKGSSLFSSSKKKEKDTSNAKAASAGKEKAADTAGSKEKAANAAGKTTDTAAKKAENAETTGQTPADNKDNKEKVTAEAKNSNNTSAKKPDNHKSNSRKNNSRR